MNYGVFLKGDGLIGTTVAICIVIGFIVGLLLIRIMRGHKNKVARDHEDPKQGSDETQRPVQSQPQREVVDSELNQPQPDVTTGELARELYISDKDRAVMAAAGGPMQTAEDDSHTCGLAVKGQNGYLTNVFCVRKGRIKLVELLLAEPLGNAMDREPAVPFHGHYMAIEIKEGVFKAYDPRQEPVIRKNTPQECFDATHWNDEVDGVYANQSETQEKISMFIIGLAIVLNFLVCLVALGKLK